MTAQPDLAQEVTLAELLDLPATADVSIRFLCALRKALATAPELTNDECEIELEINRAYHRITRARREQAFANPPHNVTGHGQEIVSIARPLPQTLPVPAVELKISYAPHFNKQRARALVVEFLREHDGSVFTFGQLKPWVEAKHLEGGKTWMTQDIQSIPSNLSKRWEQTLSSVMCKLRSEDRIVYRETRKDYYILPSD